MKHTEPIAQKVRKLLKLADKDRNNSEAEANAALMKAMELIERYDLRPDEYGEEHGETIEYSLSDYSVSVLHVSKSLVGWRKMLAMAAAEATGCKLVTTYVGSPKLMKHLDERDDETLRLLKDWGLRRGGVITVTGREEDRAVCRAIFEYLCETCDRLAKAHVRKVSAEKKARQARGEYVGHISPRSEGNGYRCSYASGVANQVAEKRRAQRGERVGNALMVLETEEEFLRRARDEIWGNLRAGSRLSYQHNQSAYTNGSRAYLGRNTMGGNGRNGRNGAIGLPG